MVGYSRDDFEVPVEDYDFSRVTDVGSLIDQMSRAGGFTASKLAKARDILREAISRSDGEESSTGYHSLPVYALQEPGDSSLRH